MKKILLFVCFAVFSFGASAQRRSVEPREPYKLKQEISLKFGWIDDGDYWWNDNDGWQDYDWYYDEGGSWHPSSGKYYKRKYYTQAISLSYMCEVNRWLALGVMTSYSGIYQDREYHYTITDEDRYRKHRISAVPMVRFTYLNRPIIRLYSALGLGLGIESEKYFGTDDYDTDAYLYGQVTFLGVQVGKKVFGLCEIGIGPSGVVSAGVGYRF